MTPERWQRVKEIFAQAELRPPEERAALVDELCGGDADMRREVESLLESSGETWSLLDGPAVSPTELLAAARALSDLRAGSRLGPYEIVSEIGRGGMGTVYRGQRVDGHFQQTVAIKLLRRGMDTDAIVERFVKEREILARLHHPNIAQLYDGGASETGLPYFVMENVEGEPLLVYCDRRKLSSSQRLALFRGVCAAVHYAHQNLIVHRDIKPSNILVTADGVVKLLDFGIAKILDPAAEPLAADLTATGLRAMTPDYASPEQLQGGAVTTATDVYSLGVVLYELLTGERPYKVRTGGVEELARVVSEEEPARPSTIRPKLKGDLDNIVLMAMRKDPLRRYASAEQLSDDIQRHLDGEPVRARQDTLGYRAGKFVRRNRIAVSAAVLVAASLVVGIGVALRQASIARVERARAERRFNDVRRLANSYLFEIHDRISELPGSTPARQLIVKRALEYLDSLQKESANDAGLQRELAAAYQKLGDVQGDRATANLGNTAGALESYRKALALRESLSAGQPRDAAIQGELALTLDSLGETLRQTGDKVVALASFRRSLQVREALVAADPGGTTTRRQLATSHHRMATFLADEGRYSEALPVWRREMDIFEALWKEDPKDARAQRNAALSYKYTGSTMETLGDTAGALELYRKAVALDEARSAADVSNMQARADLSFSYGALAIGLFKTNDVDGALDTYGKALAIREEMARADPTNANAQKALARAHSKIAFFRTGKHDLIGALENHRKAVAIYEAVSRADPANESVRENVAENLAWEAEAVAALASSADARPEARAKNWRDARSVYQRSLDILLDLRKRGVLSGAKAGEPDRVAAEIAKCDAALKKRGRRA